jgi:hypothetical protein
MGIDGLVLEIIRLQKRKKKDHRYKNLLQPPEHMREVYAGRNPDYKRKRGKNEE